MSEGDRLVAKGNDYTGDNTGSVGRMFTKAVGKGVDYVIGNTASTFEGVANLAMTSDSLIKKQV